MVRVKQTARKNSLTSFTPQTSTIEQRLKAKRDIVAARKKKYKKNDVIKATRARPGVAALRDIRRLQKSVHTLIPRISFQRVVRDICARIDGERMGNMGFKWQSLALQALQEAAEMFLTCFFEDANLCAFHAKRVTIFPRDLDLVRRLRNESILHKI